jgi:hypothetical protein
VIHLLINGAPADVFGGFLFLLCNIIGNPIEKFFLVFTIGVFIPFICQDVSLLDINLLIGFGNLKNGIALRILKNLWHHLVEGGDPRQLLGIFLFYI